MTAACHIESANHGEPGNKRTLIGDVGRRLSARHGTRKYYRADQVRHATLDAGHPIDAVRWAHCIFLTEHDFRVAHPHANDYAAMKASILADLAPGGNFLPIDLDLSWLAWPDIDVATLVDWADFS